MYECSDIEQIDFQKFLNIPKRGSTQVKPFEIEEIRRLEAELALLEREEESIKKLEEELKVSQESRPRGTSAPGILVIHFSNFHLRNKFST